MAATGIDHLIINSPYEEPKLHWHYHRDLLKFSEEPGRRSAGYIIATPGQTAFDDPGVFKEIPLVNLIRPRVKAWREAGYPGATSITKRLLEHWNDPEARKDRRFFFCQMEAIETCIWLAEAPETEKVGIKSEGDGGPFERICSKMATGSGKTIVMAMLIAWHVLNKASNGQDKRFSKNIIVVAPGLTVKNRLQVLDPCQPGNYYEIFDIVPGGLHELLLQAKIIIRNWHALAWETDERIKKKRGVDKRGAKSDEAYAREVLGDMAKASHILIINDEAHHAWRSPAEFKGRREDKELFEEATVWLGGLDRIDRVCGILRCHDFSATPFAPSGKKSYEEALFTWIVSDFGLNDAIESGLVKTPRVVIRDDTGKYTKDYKSRFYHIYMDDEVRDDINRPAQAHEPLPDLVNNAYYLLGMDWLETKKAWEKAGCKTPPVMISVANRTETAARIKHTFDKSKINIEELCNPEATLHIDSKVLKEAESVEESPDASPDDIPEDNGEKKLTKKEQAERLRKMVDTVGQMGEPGEQIQNVISVGMLSEGWDAKTVTHILGLRAFSSQLLCEQVVGRGLRRTSYEVGKNGFFDAEYVNIFGVPFTFLPHEGGADAPPRPPTPKTRVEPERNKRQYEISWPNIIRIDHVFKPILALDLAKVPPFRLNAADTAKIVDLAPVVAGKPDFDKISEIDMLKLGNRSRLQKIIFETSRDIFEQISPTWSGSKDYLLAQLVGIVEKYINSDRINITPASHQTNEIKRRVLLTLNMQKIVQQLIKHIRCENAESLTPIFDALHPIRSTGDMMPWYTGKPCHPAKKTHINVVVYDSTWEASEAFVLDRSDKVEAWVKNDHLGFEIVYIYKGVVHKYRPDFIVRLKNGSHLILEVKGEDDEKNRAKRSFLDEWVKAVNEHGGFGKWKPAVAFTLEDIAECIDKAVQDF